MSIAIHRSSPPFRNRNFGLGEAASKNILTMPAGTPFLRHSISSSVGGAFVENYTLVASATHHAVMLVQKCKLESPVRGIRRS